MKHLDHSELKSGVEQGIMSNQVVCLMYNPRL